jgi:alkanesulfonate monooxygenase SsuD/methylene tetrahydromethanopterin reductase-like flavin-dependent oxidoreductase (luciferase family)
LTLQVGLDIPARIGGIDPVAAARHAEGLGFDFLTVNDHVLGGGPRYEGWTLLAWLAASTSTIRLGPRVLGVPFREPVLVAKMAETFDRLSGGRLILGLGAGSGESEFAAMGLPRSSVGERVAALEEAITILKGIWSETPYTYRGKRYSIEGAELEPKPQRQIPLWLGTVGPRGLELTGRVADGWIPSISYAPPDRVGRLLVRILAAAQAVGRDPAAIERIYNLEITFERSSEPLVVHGSARSIQDQLRGFIDLGFTGFNLLYVGADRELGIQRLAREVIPALRSGA